MNGRDTDLLLSQIKSIILNEPISSKDVSSNDELEQLQETIQYLSNCLSEACHFSNCLSKGNLDAIPPSRHNFLAGGLKELHSGLLHLAWQAEQVAKGDYHQRVDFLGTFSTSFNTMVLQLEERENKLKERAEMIEQSRKLMVSVMDGVQEWIIVINPEEKNIIYENKAAKEGFYHIESKDSECSPCCQLLKELINYNAIQKEDYWEFICISKKRVLKIASFHIDWNGTGAFAHLISDITDEREKEVALENMAYQDALTNLYNRRYCFNTLKEWLAQKTSFSICYIDIDRLKYVNDQFGHMAGDDYIKTVATTVVTTIRGTDVACRIGGDEFVVLMAGCPQSVVEEKMDQIREVICTTEKDYAMSISFGVIEVSPSTIDTADSLLEKADKIMYSFKKATYTDRKD